MDIGAAIKFYREAHHLTQKELADKLSISPSTIGMYEQNRRIPDITTLANMSKIFDVSIEYLLGLEKSDSKGNCDNFFYEKGLANWNIKTKAKELGLSYEDVLQRTDIERERFDALWFGNAQPFAEELLRFSEVLNVSIDFLLDNSQREKMTAEEEIILIYYKQYPDEIMDLLNSFCSLSKKNRTILLGRCFELEEHITQSAPPSTADDRLSKPLVKQ